MVSVLMRFGACVQQKIMKPSHPLSGHCPPAHCLILLLKTETFAAQRFALGLFIRTGLIFLVYWHVNVRLLGHFELLGLLQWKLARFRRVLAEVKGE